MGGSAKAFPFLLPACFILPDHCAVATLCYHEHTIDDYLQPHRETRAVHANLACPITQPDQPLVPA